MIWVPRDPTVPLTVPRASDRPLTGFALAVAPAGAAQLIPSAVPLQVLWLPAAELISCLLYFSCATARLWNSYIFLFIGNLI